MGFSFLPDVFRSKTPDLVVYGYKLHEAFNEAFSFFQTNHPDCVEEAKEDFVKLTGTFDEEHEYFESKLDDFRSWFIFFYGGELFSNIKRIQKDEKTALYHDYLVSGVFSYFQVQKIKGDQITLKDLSSNLTYNINNGVAALSMEKGDCVQTSLYYIDNNLYEFGVSMVAHPVESLKYIKKKIKEVKKGKGISKEQFFERLIGMRYQFFKYKQLEVKQIYSDKSLLFEKMSDQQKK